MARDQTDVARFSTTPVLGAAGVVTLKGVRCVLGWVKHIASVMNATKPDRTIVQECNRTRLYKLDDALRDRLADHSAVIAG